MFFHNIEFHNTDHLEKTENGYAMVRIPNDVRLSLNQTAKERAAYFGTGIELRFIMKSDTVKLVLRAETAAEAQVAYVAYGSIPGGWQDSSRIIGTENTVIEIKRHANQQILDRIHADNNLPFSANVVRVILPYCKVYFVDADGITEPPRDAQLPTKTYLAYGSSITHGSMGLTPLMSYPYCIAEELKTDYINLGFPGSAYLEPEIAKYILSRKDWDFATMEIGINLLGRMEVQEFSNRARMFLDILSEEKRPVLCTDIVTTGADITDSERIESFRRCIRDLTVGRFPYKCGREIMTETSGISGDLIHPNKRGMQQICENMLAYIRENIKI